VHTPWRRWLAACALAGLASLAGLAGAGSWDELPSLGVPRQEIAAAWLDGALYAIGGFDARGGTLASVERWRPGDAAWETVAALPVAVNHPAAGVVDGRLVVVGGYRGPFLANPTDAVQVFDPATGAWSLAASLPTARGGLAAAVLDARLIAVGGARDGVSVTDVAAYDAMADAWTVLASMPTPRDHLGVAVLDGRLHAIGGRAGGHDHGAGDPFTLTVHEVYDPEADAWSAAAELPTGRSGHAVAALGGCVYAFGGEGNRATPDGMFDEVERFVASGGAWERLGVMPVPRHGMGAVSVDGRVLVPGGGVVAGLGATDHADAFTPPACP
jgi:N-acetylneuraminic acid mutarotase